MKDYSFGDTKYQKSFILNYRFEEKPMVFNGRTLKNMSRSKIILYLAKKTATELENTYENIQAVIDKMERQIKKAYKKLQQILNAARSSKNLLKERKRTV